MKTYLLGNISTITILEIFGFIIETIESNVSDKERIIAPRFTLQDRGSKEEPREWLENEYLLLYREFPGWNAMIGEPVKSSGYGTTINNATEKGDFILIYFCDSKEILDHYWPGDSSMSDYDVNGIAKHQATFDKYFVQDKYQNEGYSLFTSSK